MNFKLLFRCIFMFAGIFAIMQLSAQRFNILEAFVSHKSYIKQMCTSSLAIDHPGICADCNTIEKVFSLNKMAGDIERNLQIIQQQKSRSSISFLAKKLFEKGQTDKLKDLEIQCRNLSPEYTDSIQRLIPIIDIIDTEYDQDFVLARETELLQQGLVNAARGVSADDSL